MNQSNTKFQKRTILIIDDDENVCVLYKINLEKLGYHVLTVNNSTDALQIFNESLSSTPIDVAIIDLSLPGSLTGNEIASEIKKLNSDVKLIVSSGNTESAEMLHHLDYGFDASIEKTFKREKIKQTVESVLGISEIK